MEWRTHIWGMFLTAALLMALVIGGVAWLRPLPNRAAGLCEQVEATWDAHAQGHVTVIDAADDLFRFASSGPRFGEALRDGESDDPYDHVHQRAIERLGQLEGDEALNRLRVLALSPDRQISLHAVEALRRRRDPRAIATYFEVLRLDDARQRRIGDHFARVTQETLRAIREQADSATLTRLRHFAEGQPYFEQDVRRTVRLIMEDQQTAGDMVRDPIQSLGDLDNLLAPSPDRLNQDVAPLSSRP